VHCWLHANARQRADKWAAFERKNAMNKQPTLQEVLDELLAAGLVEIKGMRDGRPVYVATNKARKVHISEPPKATQ
jgi:hypothetical protein